MNTPSHLIINAALHKAVAARGVTAIPRNAFLLGAVLPDLFPFEWSVRFQSPVSYWDPRFFGREFTVFELLLDLVLLLYLFGPGLWRRLRRGAVAPQER